MWYTGYDGANTKIGYAIGLKPSPAYITQEMDWVKYPANLCLNETEVSQPSVVFAEDNYRLWYKSGNNISYAKSADMITWERYPSNPVLCPGIGGNWDGNFVSQPTVLYNGSFYQMWYTGYDGTNMRIGYATSTNGAVWNKYAGNPVLPLGGGGNFDDVGISDPSVLYKAGVYHMWYAGYDGGSMRIGYATSTNGLAWNKYSNNPVLGLGANGDFDDAGVNSPSVLFDGSRYYIFYAGYNGSSKRVGYATSTDGSLWYRASSNPVLNLGTDGNWDDSGVSDPSILHKGERYYIYYTGFDGANIQTGYAIGQGSLVPDHIRIEYFDGTEVGAVQTTTDNNFTLYLKGYDSEDNLLGDFAGTWTVLAGIGNCSPTYGTFVVFDPTTVGDGTITATYNDLTDSTGMITVTHGSATSINILPKTKEATADDNIVYTAIAKDQDGNPWDVTDQTTFTEDDPQGIMTNNTYYAGQVGIHTITGTHTNGLTDTADVTVIHGSATSISITPPNLDMYVDEVVGYSVIGTDSDGNSYDATDQSTFTTTGGGTFTDNKFKAENTGTWTIMAHYLNLVATTTVQIEGHGDAIEISLHLSTETVSADGTITCTVYGTDSFGNSWDATAKVDAFSTNDPGGTFSNNFYYPGKAAQWAITAELGTLTATATITVTHGLAVAIEITPVNTILTADDTQQYNGTATDSDGNQWDATAEITWTENDPVGTMGANVYYAGQVGTWTITGTYNTFVATATVEVTPGAFVNIAIIDAPTTTTTYAAFVITVILYDNDGNPYTGDVAMTNTAKTIVPSTISLISGSGTTLATITTVPSGGTDTITVTYGTAKAAKEIKVFINSQQGGTVTDKGAVIEFDPGDLGTTNVTVHIATSTEAPAEPLPGDIKFVGIVYEIDLIDEQGNEIGTQTGQIGLVTVYLSYLDEDQDGWVDGTNIKEETLIIYQWDNGDWKALDTTVIETENVAWAYVPHFSTFALGETSTIIDLIDVIVYPNPFILHKHRFFGITFKNLTDQATIKIFNINGEMIKEIEHTQGTEEVWMIKANQIASGVYIYLITNDQNQKAVGKIGIVK